MTATKTRIQEEIGCLGSERDKANAIKNHLGFCSYGYISYGYCQDADEIYVNTQRGCYRVPSAEFLAALKKAEEEDQEHQSRCSNGYDASR